MPEALPVLRQNNKLRFKMHFQSRVIKSLSLSARVLHGPALRAVLQRSPQNSFPRALSTIERSVAHEETSCRLD